MQHSKARRRKDFPMVTKTKIEGSMVRKGYAWESRAKKVVFAGQEPVYRIVPTALSGRPKTTHSFKTLSEIGAWLDLQ